MAIEQVRFLGSSITGYSCNLGWGTQESRLNVGLVDDWRNGDGFNPPDVGSPVYFNYEGFKFDGILERWSQERSSGGNPVYSVSVVDPRVLLGGVQLILSDYYGATFIPNVLNIFGFLENVYGFGGSQLNDSGIPYSLVLSAVLSLIGGISNYGGPISYKGFSYGIDLSALPQINGFYRVSASPSMSLMDFINEICEAGACEYFFILDGNTIVLKTLSRRNIPLRGVITQFVNQTQGAVSLSSGLDMVNETVGKFLIGGAVTDMFFSFFGTGIDGNPLSSTDNPIWYYWGTDNDGNLITSDGPNQDFYLDARSVLINGIGDVYLTDMNEMRAALAGQDSWEQFLWLNCFNQFEFDSTGTNTDFIYKIDENGNFVQDSSGQYLHNGYNNPHFKKAYNLGVDPVIDYTIVSFLMGSDITKILSANMSKILWQQKKNESGIDKEEEDDMSKLYGLIQSYADEYYGRKFMVILPNIYVKQEPDTLEYSFSHSISEGGYLTDDVIANAINSNIIPPDTSNITLPDGRFSSFVRFDNIENLDLTFFQPQDLMFGQDLIKNSTSSGYDQSGVNSVFVRCTVDDNLVFIDNNFNSPRAIITLTSRALIASVDRYSETQIVDFLDRANKASLSRVKDEQLQEISNKIITSVNGDVFSLLSYPKCIIPSMAAIPLKSNINTYGPWYGASANGKIEVEHAEDLVPWNYGSYSNMNIAANSRVILSEASLQWMESGDVEFPGAPINQLGDQLLENGPYITDIRVSVGVDGVKTQYSMRSWQPQFGRAAKFTLDLINKSYKLSQQIRRNMYQQFKLNSFKNIYLNIKNQLPNIQ